VPNYGSQTAFYAQFLKFKWRKIMKKNSILSDMLLGLILGLILTPFISVLLIMTESYTKIGIVNPVIVGVVVIPIFMIIFAVFFRNKKTATGNEDKK
jgi:hypothetical protein